MLAHHQGRICSAMRCRHLPKRGPWKGGRKGHGLKKWLWYMDLKIHIGLFRIFMHLYQSLEPLFHHFPSEIALWRLPQFQSMTNATARCGAALPGAFSIMTDRASSKVSKNFCFKANSNGRTSARNETNKWRRTCRSQHVITQLWLAKGSLKLGRNCSPYPPSLTPVASVELPWPGNSAPRNPMVIFQPRIATCCQQDTSGLQGSMLTGVVQSTATVPWTPDPPLALKDTS